MKINYVAYDMTSGSELFIFFSEEKVNEGDIICRNGTRYNVRSINREINIDNNKVFSIRCILTVKKC